jgi:DNA (cytosine-5)-methyltransferase 1
MGITATDMFCGAGGTSLGASLAGVEVKLGMNHWPVACESFNTNHQNALVACADVVSVDPRAYPTTDILLASPECTHHSYARGRPKDDPSLFDPDGNMGAERSRATMWDVIRFTEHHMYKAIIVENVGAAVKWGLPRGRKLTPGGYGPLFHAWLMGMTGLGYEFEIKNLNSMTVGVPQSRDRLYVVFWRKGMRRPDLNLTPPCFCGHCMKVVEGQQRWKREGLNAGTYGQQYEYACPTCFARVVPIIRPAASAIDWSLPAERIGDRTTPLKPNTVARIRRGLDGIEHRPDIVTLEQLMAGGLASDPDGLIVQTGGNLSERPGQTRAWGTDVPFKVVTGTADRALIVPTTHGGGGDRARSVDQVLPTATGRQEQALVVPNNTNNVPQDPDGQPLGTITTGNRHALVVANRRNAVAKDAAGNPLHTLDTKGAGYVIEPPAGHPDSLVYAGRENAVPKPAHGEPMQTQTTINSLYVVQPMQIDLRGENRPRAVDGEPTSTIHAGGNIHGLAFVVANYSPGWTRDAAIREMGTITATDSHSLLTYRGPGDARSIEEPATTLTSHAQHAVLGHRVRPSDIAVDDCSFRMLQPHELQAAQGFTPEYVVTGNKRDQVAQIGNAVSPPAAHALVQRVVDALDA